MMAWTLAHESCSAKFLGIAIVVAITLAFGCAERADTDNRTPMNIDLIDICASMESSARCDANHCIEIVCWQQIGASATPCPRVIDTDFDAVAQVMDSLNGTYPVPNGCSGEEMPFWNLHMSTNDEEIWPVCPSWDNQDGHSSYPAVIIDDQTCYVPPPELVDF